MQQLKTVIVEDSEDDAELLRSQLRDAGYECIGPCVETEADFIAGLKNSPEIIFSDFSMPQFSGLRALEIVQAQAPDIPFILISGTVGEDVAVESMRLGATDYLLKGYTLPLPSAVARALAGKNLKHEQAKAIAELKQSEERFREVVENIAGVFWVSDARKTQIYYVSPGYERIWGFGVEDLYKNPQRWIECIHEDDRERVRASALTQQAIGAYDETYRIVRSDGERRWIHDRAFPIYDDVGKVKRIVGIAEDISLQKKLEEDLRQSQKMQAIGRLAGGVAHDFNNILQAMLMQIELGLERVPQDGTRQILLALRQSAERASQLTRQLLSFSRKGEIRLARCDLNTSVSNMAKMLERLVGEHIGLSLKLHDAPLMLVADAGMLDQVLLNLVVNARDAMPRGGVVEISTGLEQHDALSRRVLPEIVSGWYARLTVRDTGEGIATEHMPHLFEPFFTTKEVGKGTGLGLPVVFSVATQHNGAVHVASTVGKGTQFDVLFPLVTPKAQSAPIAEKIRHIPGNGNILLVEDDDDVRELTRTLLERNGYRVFAVASADDARKVFAREKKLIHILFTDIMLPGKQNGRELAGELQKQNPELHVIFASGYSHEPNEKSAPLPAGQIFLQKPYSIEKLFTTLRDARTAEK
ncbi:MAG: response regulator [Spirochaetes bacterium]|nr:response regulator [Spirochaetota bacterium]